MKKKLLALGLALAMTLGMGTVAFAGTYIDVTEVDIEKTYELKGEGKSPAETFEVEQVGEGKVTDGDAESAPALESISIVEYAEGAAGSADKTGKFTVKLPKYEKTGVYEYTLQEVAGTTAGVTYRAKTMKLVVTVVEENGLKRVAAVHTEDENGDKSYKFSDNTYTANTLSVSKKVTGNLGDKSKEFKFTVVFKAPVGKDWTNAITVKAGGGEAAYEMVGNTATFTLSDSDTITFENIPAGVKYKVTEDDYTGEDYKTTYDDNESGTMANEAISTTVTNNKEKDVDTGINLDNMPYIVILAVVVVAGAAFVVSRRRRFE